MTQTRHEMKFLVKKCRIITWELKIEWEHLLKCFSNDLTVHGKITSLGYQENEMKNSRTAHNKVIVTEVYSACGVQHESENKAYLWVISALQASNWSQITFCNLTNAVTSISERICLNFEQMNISPWEDSINLCLHTN